MDQQKVVTAVYFTTAVLVGKKEQEGYLFISCPNRFWPEVFRVTYWIVDLETAIVTAIRGILQMRMRWVRIPIRCGCTAFVFILDLNFLVEQTVTVALSVIYVIQTILDKLISLVAASYR